MVRSPLQVDEEFLRSIKKIQSEIMGNKKEFKSLTKITREIIRTPEWKEIEKKLIKEVQKEIINIKFDRRGI